MSDSVAPEELEVSEVCEGGNLDCGSGLLLLIRKAMQQVPGGEVLEIRSTEISVREDLPAWCRMTENPYLGWSPAEGHNRFFVRRGGDDRTAEEDYRKARDYRWRTRVHWDGASTSTVYCRNHSWPVGQPASFDLQDEAPSAVEYVLGALGACLATGFQVRASRENVEVEEMEISLSGKIDNIFVFLGTEQEGHSGFEAVEGAVYVQSDADEEILEELWRATVAASPVANSLVRGVGVNVGMRVV